MACPNIERSTKRLMSDLKQLRSKPVPNVAAKPLDDNIYEWHCNVLMHQHCYHLILKFPDNYPLRPPKAEMRPWGYTLPGIATSITESGLEMCLEVFSEYDSFFHENQTWSDSYTVQGILMTMVGFLEEELCRWPEKIVSNMEEGASFKCADCGHSTEIPDPLFLTSPEIPQESPNIPHKSPEIPHKSQEMPQESPEIPRESQEMPQESPEIPRESPKIPQESPEPPLESSLTPHESPGIPHESPKIPH